MNRILKKAAVIGSGVMGSRIACHLANAGLQVILLDIIPFELSEEELQNGIAVTNPKFRNRIVNSSLLNAIKSNPSPIYKKSFQQRIQTGNLEDDMSMIADCDWVIEAVVERLDIKQKVYSQIESHRKRGSILSTNTSGIPISILANHMSDEMKTHFIGTHFFNPPRYLQLLEVIPHIKTDPEIAAFMLEFGRKIVGKTTVLCKDTPAFIANRVGVFSIMALFHEMENFDFSISEIDKLTGPIIGRPKSATFRTCDVVGIDTLAKVALGVKEHCPNDEKNEVFKLPDFLEGMVSQNLFGDKTKQGFYKKTLVDGKKEILGLNLKTLTYEKTERPKLEALDLVKNEEDLKKRIRILAGGADKVGDFYRKHFFGVFGYASNRIPEIADNCYQIDDAMKAGFGWELGPFEIWDILGVENSLQLMAVYGIKPAIWVEEMIKSGYKNFYQYSSGSVSYYDISSKSYKSIDGKKDFIFLQSYSSNIVWQNSGSILYDLGDGILNLEFKTKMNTMGGEVLQGISKSIGIAEKDFSGLVIANEAQNFSVGANLGMVFMFAIEQDWDELNMAIRQFQKTVLRARYSNIPVVVAPRGMTLGGGCELSLHADRLQFAAESYIGLVETGVGVIPAGGGTKELAKRFSNSIQNGDIELNRLQNTFLNVAMAKVSTSAHEAYDLGYMQAADRISINPHAQIADAKALCLQLATEGYTQPIPEKIKVLGKSALALFTAGIFGMKQGRFISDHDAKVASKLAYALSGGDLSQPQEVTETYMLDLEREAFLSLCGEKKTLERMQSLLKTGKIIRN